jgi:hypothetical protein
LHLPFLEESLFLGIVDGRVFELFAEVAEVFLEVANAGEALVVVLLDAGALDVDLFLGLVGAVLLFEQLLHVHSGDVEFALLRTCNGDEGSGERGGEESAEECHWVVD